MKLVLTGIQGSGKSTQGSLLSKELKIPYLSTGHIFRDIAKEKTKLGTYVKAVMNAGLLIPDDRTIEVVKKYLSRPEYKRGFIIDGFPRTLEQAKYFEKIVDKVIYLEIPDKEVLWRLSYRKDERDDESLEALRKRIELFHRHTQPVIEHFKKLDKLAVVDGTLSIKDVNEEILKSIGKQLVKKHIESWRQKKKTIIVIVGLPGSSKDEAVKYFKKQGLSIVTIQSNGDSSLNKKEISAAFKDHPMIILKGVTSWDEYQTVRNEFPRENICLLAIHADREMRYSRLSKNKPKKIPEITEKDIEELLKLRAGALIAFADFLVKDTYQKEDLYEKLEEVYRTIYFS